MTYRQTFNRLGNPVARRSETPLGHKIIQRLGVLVSVVLLGILLWGGK